MNGGQIHRIESQDGVRVICFDREAFNPAGIEAMKADAVALVEHDGCTRLVVDMTGLEHASSVFLGAMMQMSLMLGRRDAQLRVCGMNQHLAQLFDMMRLGEAVQIHPDRTAALASFEDADA